MKTKLKSLLALALSVLIGHAWAATPVAIWTDFNTLTSGNYTLTADGGTVNDDGSITLGGAGLSLPVSGNQITVVMDVSNVPTTDGIVVASVKMNDQYVNLKSTGTQLIQSWNNGGNYGSFDWEPAKRQTIVLGTRQSNSSGTTTWIDGQQKATRNDLMTSSGSLQNVYIGSYDGTSTVSAEGMIIHSLRIYSTKLTDEEADADYKVGNVDWVASFDDNNSMVGWITNWDGESTLAYINTPNAQGGVIASGCHPYKNYTFNQPFTIALYANIADVDVGTAANGAALIALGKPGESNQGAGNLVLAKTAVDKVALSRSGTKLVEITAEDLSAADSYHLFVFGMDAGGNTFLSVDGKKMQSESPTTYPDTGLQIGSMYTGIDSYIRAYGMIVDEIRGYSAYLNDDDLAKLATRFPAESRSISDSSLMYNWTGKASGKLYTLSSPVVMPSADITSFTATVQYKNGSSRIEIAGVKLVDGEGNEFIGATNDDGASFTGGNSGNNVYTFTNNAGFSGDSYTLYVTLWVNGSTGTGRITLSEGVTFNDLFTESETGSIIMPAQRLSANEGNVTIPSGFALTVQGGDSEVEIAKVITVNGSLTTMGALNFSAANRVAAGGTLEVATGETKFNLAGSGFSGKLKVASGATFKNGTNDGPNYNGAPVLDIAGTLEVTETARWSLGANSQMILRDGAVLKGAGGTGYNYAFDWFNGAIINVLGNATIEGNIGGHISGAILTFNVAEGKTLTIAGKFDGGTHTGYSSLAVSGAGTLKLTNAENNYRGTTTINASATLELEGGSLGTRAVTGAGNLVCTGVLPPATAALNAEAWTGTVKVQNFTGGTESESAELDLDAYGNANSVVELANVAGRVADGTVVENLKLSDSFSQNNGSISNPAKVTIKKLSGSGNFNGPSGNDWQYVFIVNDCSEFTGSVNLKSGGHGGMIGMIIGTAPTDYNHEIYRKHITVMADGVANVAATWTPATGASGMTRVYGTIGGAGSIASVLEFFDGATIDGSVTATGNVTLPATGTVTVSGEAGATVLTCANAASLDLTKFAAPAGLKCVAENGAVKLAVANVPFNPATAESTESMSVEVAAAAAATADDAMAMVVIQRPEGVVDVVTAEAYAGYFVKTAAQGDNGNWIVTIALSDEVKPVIGTEGEDADDAFTVDADGVTIAINNYKPGLYYGIRSATELGALKDVEAVEVAVEGGKINVDKLTGDSAFYQVVVDVKPFPVNGGVEGDAPEAAPDAE